MCYGTPLLLVKRYSHAQFSLLSTQGRRRGGWARIKKTSPELIRVECPDVWSFLPCTYWAHQYWWCWDIWDIKRISWSWVIINFRRVYVLFCDGSRRYWPHHIERLEWQIEVRQIRFNCHNGGSEEAMEEIFMTSLACASDNWFEIRTFGVLVLGGLSSLDDCSTLKTVESVDIDVKELDRVMVIN